MPLGLQVEDPKRLNEVFLEAKLLGDRAYLKGEPRAFASAERMLYLIHVLTGFSEPLQPGPAAAWGALMRAKLSAALSLGSHPQPGEIGFLELKKELEKLVQEAEEQDHSFIDEISAKGDLKGLVLYAKNWIVTAYGFVEQLAGLFQHCQGRFRRVVQENIADEFRDTPHPELRERFLKRIGVHYDPIAALEDPDYLVEAMSVLNFRTGVTKMSNPYYALGSFYSVEAVFSLVSHKLTQGLPGFGLEKESYEMFTLHATVDKDHAADWVAGLNDPSVTGRDRALVLIGAKAQMHIRHRLFSAMREKLRNF